MKARTARRGPPTPGRAGSAAGGSPHAADRARPAVRRNGWLPASAGRVPAGARAARARRRGAPRAVRVRPPATRHSGPPAAHRRTAGPLLRAAPRPPPARTARRPAQRRIRAPPQRARSDFDQAVRVRQRAAQVVQDLGQVRMRLALSRVGPEQERQALTRLRRVAVEQQVGKQRFGPRGVQRRELPLPGPEIHGPEQPRVQNRRTYLRMLPYLVPAPSRSDHNREGGSARNARPDAGTQQQRPAYVEGPTVSPEGARP